MHRFFSFTSWAGASGRQRSLFKNCFGFIMVALVAVGNIQSVWAQASEKPDELEVLVQLARTNHPNSIAARQRTAAAREVPSRVSSLPDPMLVTTAQNFRLDDIGLGTHPMTGLVFGLTQMLPFPGKLDAKERVAKSMAAVAAVQVENLEEDIELRVRRLYWQLHYAERAKEIVTENEDIVNLLTNVVHARFAVGQGAQQDAMQAQVAHSTLRADLAAREQVLSSTRRALNEAIGRSPDTTLATTVVPTKRSPLLSRKKLVAVAKSHNPKLAVASAQTLVARHRVAEAKRDRLPDFMAGVSYRVRSASPGDSSGGADMVSVNLGITLPLWLGDKQDASVRQQRHELSAAKSSWVAVGLAVETSIGMVADVIERLDVQLGLYEKELLPQSSLAVDASIGDYQVGKVGFVSVLQNWRTDLNLKLAYELLLAKRAQGLAELHSIVGASPLRNTP